MKTCCLGAAGALLLAGLGVVLSYSPAWVTLMLVAGGALPMWLCEWRRHRCVARPAAAAVSTRTMLHGLFLLALLFAISLVLQMALGGEKGAAVSEACLPLVAAGAVLVMLAVLRPSLLGAGLGKCGVLAAALLARRPLNAQQQVLLGSWSVRAFFLPLMMGWAYVWVASAMAAMDNPGGAGLGMFSAVMAALYAVDTSFAVTGYLLVSERLGSHVRSVDTSWQGWLAALCCYPPVSVLVLGQWLVYRDGYEWQHWLLAGSWLWWLWGVLIVLLTGVYTWATVMFGPRFSNLTHRGIVTAGPYRWLRHPAYLCKNLSWWLISIPFVSAVSGWVAVLHCLALLGVNGIYWARAVTEERHLRRDPHYVIYANWVDQHGLWAQMRRVWR